MSRLPNLLLSFAMLALLFSCKKIFEDKNSSFLAGEGDGDWYTKAYYPPQYMPTEAVVIGASTLRDKPELAKAILGSGANLVISSTDTQKTNEDLKKLSLSPDESAKTKVVQTTSDDMWIRDFGPTVTVDPLKNKYIFWDPLYYSTRGPEDKTPESLAKAYKSDLRELPVYNEGGNLMMCEQNNDRFCLVSKRIFDGDAAGGDPVKAKLKQNPEEIVTNMKIATGSQQVVVLPNLKSFGETTGHIDIYARVLAPGAVFVHSLPEGIESSFGSKVIKDMLIGVRETLNSVAKQLGDKGFKVERGTMPIPFGKVFYTHANALPVNGHMLMPVYEQRLSELQSAYDTDCTKSFGLGVTRIRSPEQIAATCSENNVRIQFFRKARAEAEAVYKQFSYIVKPIESSDTIKQGGAVHCTTLQIPKLPNGQAACSPD